MLNLFAVPWDEVELEHVQGFLTQADEEGINWEAKGEGQNGSPHAGSIRKAACGLANQVGGYLILGARKSTGDNWELSGVAPKEEPGLWIGQILRDLQPTPRFDVRSWRTPEQRFVAVVRIEPVAEPPCMTTDGRVFERVSGETLPVQDPALLDKLIRRGEAARQLAAHRAPAAATRALDASGWKFQASVALSVALAPVGRETDDVSSRLFVQDTRQAMAEATWALMLSLRPQGRPDGIAQEQRQDSHAALLHFAEQRHFGDQTEPISTNRSTWLTQANWDGSVAASLTLSDGDVGQAPPPEDLIAALWHPLAPLCGRLGGYGPCQLSVAVAVTKTSQSVVEGQLVHAPGRPPPEGLLYSRLGPATQMGRLVDKAEPDHAVADSLGRELRRAAGEVQDEN